MISLLQYDLNTMNTFFFFTKADDKKNNKQNNSNPRHPSHTLRECDHLVGVVVVGVCQVIAHVVLVLVRLLAKLKVNKTMQTARENTKHKTNKNKTKRKANKTD
jgi:hypothetical protein